MDEPVSFASLAYNLLLALLVFSRGMDFLSTWIATPNLLLEANPVAKKLGWRWGIAVNLAVCVLLAAWPLPAIILITTSLLVAARNLQSAWLMHSMGEEQYRFWIADRLAETNLGLYYLCLLGQSVLTAGVGAALMSFSGDYLVPFAIGAGMIAYAVAVLFFTTLSVWRIRQKSSRAESRSFRELTE